MISQSVAVVADHIASIRFFLSSPHAATHSRGDRRRTRAVAARGVASARGVLHSGRPYHEPDRAPQSRSGVKDLSAKNHVVGRPSTGPADRPDARLTRAPLIHETDPPTHHRLG